MTNPLGIAKHLDPPDKSAAGREKGTRRPGQRTVVAAQGHPGQRGQIREIAPGQAGRPGVGGQLLLEPQPGRQPVRQGMIELQGQAELGERGP